MNTQSGNVFFAIFGAVALVGVLTAGVSTFVRGPLATSVKITRMNTAENQMSIAGQVAVMAAANAPGGGDCDSDTFVEPIEWREDLTKPFPVGGGLIPMSIGISKKDPWGTEYGYCVWDHGPATNGAGTCGGAAQKRLSGHNSKIYPVVALVSAGPDKIFTTTCRSFDDADVDNDGSLDTVGVDLPMVGKANSNDDDIIFTYSYEEATGASGGLWSLKSGDPGTAVIDKKIESTGVGSFQGGILLPDSSLITCDPTTAGIMARSASGGNGIQICDGSGWQEISGSASGSGLILTPNVSTGMNILGTCGTPTCYSSDVVFTLTNKLTPAANSVALVVTLSNTLNFEKVSDNCNGNIIAPNATCQIVVRAKASGNISYASELRVTGNNSPLAMLDGTASSFPGCNAGGNAPGGYYLACGIAGHDLVVTPSGCTAGMTNPTCAGGPDTTAMPVMTGGDHTDAQGCCTTANGQQNTANMIAYSHNAPTTYPAASWCDGLIYQGFDDWFLPSGSEMTSYFFPNRGLVGWGSGEYWISNEHSSDNTYWRAMQVTGIVASTSSPGSNRFIRCMRWTPAKPVSPIVDTTPVDVIFTPSYGGAAQVRTSNTVTIRGIAGTVNVSISGGTASAYSINGGAYTNAPGTANNGDQITLQSTSPVAGQESLVAITIGSSTFNWQVRTPGNNTIRVFTRNATSTGNFGSVGAADALCTSSANAANLPGNWVAVMVGAPGSSINERLPWNWTVLKNLNGVGAVVATGASDFLDGTISAPMNYDQNGNVVASAVWTGLNASGFGANGGGIGSIAGTRFNQCLGWTSAVATCGSSGADGCGWLGDASNTSGGKYLSNINLACSNNARLLCMETNAAGADLDPDFVNIAPAVVYAPGATGMSRSVTLTGITDEINVTVTPTSGGTVNIIKNGVPVGAGTTTAGLNETLVFTMTAPAVVGTKNTATISLGPDNYDWWVGYADSSKEARAFTAFKSGGNFGGLAGADAVCNAAAARSPYGLSGSWKAIMSDSGTHAANRIPWNWGVLKGLTGATIVDGGYVDLMDGSLDSPINLDEMGVAAAERVYTGSDMYGMSKTYGTAGPLGYCGDWTRGDNYGGGMVIGFSTSTNGAWLDSSNVWCGGDAAYGRRIYCIENVDDVSDLTPADINLPYKIQVPAGSRQTSDMVTVSGMSHGVTQTLSVSATGGTPRVKINGGAEVSSGTIKNGDTVQFLMDAPGADVSSNRMTITAGGMTSYWRVWSGTSVDQAKRLFVTTFANPTWGGLAGFDGHCQSKATGAGLGGTWKAVMSGNSEPDWAVNRVGYNWTSLTRVDGVDLVMAGNLWSTSILPFLNAPTISETGVMLTSNEVLSNTTSFGKAKGTTGTQGSCNNFTMNSSAYYSTGGSTGTNTSQWIENSVSGGVQCYTCCGSRKEFYCIEQ